MIYLSSPYSHPDAVVRERRYCEALCAAHWLMDRKRWVFSPIVHCHPMALMGLPGDIDYWREYDRTMVERSSLLMVLMTEGWAASVGIGVEMTFADEFHVGVEFMAPTSRGYEFSDRRR